MKAGRLHDPLGDHHASAAYRSDECANRRFAKGRRCSYGFRRCTALLIT